MPIYEYKCDACKNEREVILPLSEAGKGMGCECGQVMRRKFSPAYIFVPETGKDKVLSTLNQENGYDFPGGDMHRDRYEQAMAKGLTYERPLEEKVFQGFG